MSDYLKHSTHTAYKCCIATGSHWKSSISNKLLLTTVTRQSSSFKKSVTLKQIVPSDSEASGTQMQVVERAAYFNYLNSTTAWLMRTTGKSQRECCQQSHLTLISCKFTKVHKWSRQGIYYYHRQPIISPLNRRCRSRLKETSRN